MFGTFMVFLIGFAVGSVVVGSTCAWILTRLTLDSLSDVATQLDVIRCQLTALSPTPSTTQISIADAFPQKKG
jgi:hypothetical protein